MRGRDPRCDLARLPSTVLHEPIIAAVTQERGERRARTQRSLCVIHPIVWMEKLCIDQVPLRIRYKWDRDETDCLTDRDFHTGSFGPSRRECRPHSQ